MVTNLRRGRGNKNIYRFDRPAGSKSKRRYLVFGVVGIFVLVVVIILFPGRKGEVSIKDLNNINAKIADLEKRLSNLEGKDQKIIRLQDQVKKLKQSVSKLNRSVVSKSVKRRYHVVRQGESLTRIAQQYGITVEELCCFNKITPKTVIQPGQKLLVTSDTQQ